MDSSDNSSLWATVVAKLRRFARSLKSRGAASDWTPSSNTSSSSLDAALPANCNLGCFPPVVGLWVDGGGCRGVGATSRRAGSMGVGVQGIE